MSSNTSTSSGINESKKPKWKFWLKLFAICFGLAAGGLVVFTAIFPDMHHGLGQNESAAVGALHTLNTLETRYANVHPGKGFVCDLSLLRPVANANDAFGSVGALLTGQWSGYRFEVNGCELDAHGIANHYRATAVPLKRGETGVRAFCSDESGQISLDPDGSAASCLSAHRPI